MNLFGSFVLSTLIFGTVAAVLIGHKLRHRLQHMPGMIIAMAIGMNAGLTSGVFFGSFYQGNLYFSTLLSMGFGSVAGLASGMSIGILPALEGLMSGLMGGMMGAMLGEMITGQEASILINIMLTLTVCSLLLFKVLTDTHTVGKRNWFFKPLIVFIFIFLFFIWGTQLDKNNPSPRKQHDGQHKKEESL